MPPTSVKYKFSSLCKRDGFNSHSPFMILLKAAEKGKKLVFHFGVTFRLFLLASQRETGWARAGREEGKFIKEWLKGNKSRRYYNLLQNDINLISMIRRILHCLLQVSGCREPLRRQKSRHFKMSPIFQRRKSFFLLIQIWMDLVISGKKALRNQNLFRYDKLRS